MKKLSLLGINKTYRCKHDFIIHIGELANIPIKPTDTNLDLLDNVTKYFETYDDETKKAVDEYVTLNKTKVSENDLKRIINDDDEDYLFAYFNLTN